jgi:hypothetical protein
MGTAQTRANNKYKAKSYDRIELIVPKGHKEAIQAHASNRNESLNGFVNRAINEAVERDKGNPSPIIMKEQPTNETEAASNEPLTGKSNVPVSAPAVSSSPSPSTSSASDDEFFQRYGFTKESLQKSNQQAERWNAAQEDKKNKKQRPQLSMVTSNDEAEQP